MAKQLELWQFNGSSKSVRSGGDETFFGWRVDVEMVQVGHAPHNRHYKYLNMVICHEEKAHAMWAEQ